MAYLNEDIVKYREARDEILNDLTSAEDEATKNVRLQNKVLSFYGDCDIIGLIHFNWGHSTRLSDSQQECHCQEEVRSPCPVRTGAPLPN